MVTSFRDMLARGYAARMEPSDARQSIITSAVRKGNAWVMQGGHISPSNHPCFKKTI